MYNNGMVRYLSQPSNTNICGPVAIINIMKFFGFNASSRHLSFVKYKCEYDNGVEDTGITAALRDIDSLKFYIRNNPTIELINNHLAKNGAVLLFTTVTNNNKCFGHCWIITGKKKGKYICHNYYKSTDYMTKKQLEKAIMGVSEEIPRAWFISLR